MPDCAKLAKCIFFNDQMGNMPAMADMYKLRYCKGKPEDCARLAVASKLGPERVPKDLFPNNMNRAEILLNQHSWGRRAGRPSHSKPKTGDLPVAPTNPSFLTAPTFNAAGCAQFSLVSIRFQIDYLAIGDPTPLSLAFGGVLFHL